MQVQSALLAEKSAKMSLLFNQLVARAGTMPTPATNMELYTFWVGNILPTSALDRQELLASQCATARMKVLLKNLKETVLETAAAAQSAGAQDLRQGTP